VGRLALFSFAAALAGAAIAQAEPPAATGAAASGAPATSSAPTQTAATAPSDPVICEWQEDIGTRLGSHKVCMTKSQWQREAYDSEDQLNDTTMRALGAGTPGH
jgi:hypothetical protein